MLPSQRMRDRSCYQPLAVAVMAVPVMVVMTGTTTTAKAQPYELTGFDISPFWLNSLRHSFCQGLESWHYLPRTPITAVMAAVAREILVIEYALYWAAEAIITGRFDFQHNTGWIFWVLVVQTVPLAAMSYVPWVKAVWRRIPIPPFPCNPFGVFDLMPGFCTLYDRNDISLPCCCCA